jgi:hypothetical protein
MLSVCVCLVHGVCTACVLLCGVSCALVMRRVLHDSCGGVALFGW